MTSIFENSATATRYDKTSPYKQIMRRNGKVFSAGFRAAAQPQLVAETERDEVLVRKRRRHGRRGVQRALPALLRHRALAQMLAAAWSRSLLLILCTMPIASFAGADDLEQLAKAAEAVAQASRSSEGFEASQILGRIDPKQLDLLRKTFGADAARAVGHLRVQSVGTPGTRVAPDDDVLADVLRAEPGLAQLGSMALARALRQTQQYYAGRGNPLPDAMKVMLSITFPREVLDSVRVVDTDVEASLPAIINEVQTNFGEAVGGQSAVTIDNIIAFSEIPDLSSVDFWAHEIRHVVQYRQLGGIDAFAAAYTKDYRKLENDANAVAKKAVIDAQNVLTVIHALNPNGLGGWFPRFVRSFCSTRCRASVSEVG